MAAPERGPDQPAYLGGVGSGPRASPLRSAPARPPRAPGGAGPAGSDVWISPGLQGASSQSPCAVSEGQGQPRSSAAAAPPASGAASPTAGAASAGGPAGAAAPATLPAARDTTRATRRTRTALAKAAMLQR